MVRDFDASEGDTIDISDVLDIAGYNAATDTLSDWVQITYAGAHSFLEVDRDGTGTTHGMTQIMYTESYSTLAMSDVKVPEAV
ncbi:MAG: type I secretion C-terminal target domain-containing protein [Pseudomonadota bacterium]